MRAYTAWSLIARERAWARDARGLGRSLAGPSRHRLIVSCGPPHWADHEAARHLARAERIPWVLDLRDPWSLIERLVISLASPLWLRLAARAEARALRAAALVVMNTEIARDAMRVRHPALAGRIEAVLNGVDEDPLPAPPSAGDERARRFLVAYAGTVYLDRDPRGLFRAAAKLIAEIGVGPERFGIELMGDAPAGAVEALAAEEGIARYVRVHPPGPRQAAAAFLARAAVLLSLPQDSHLALPSKIFEYMRYDAAILALAAPGSATAELLRGTGADVVAPHDVETITAALRARYREFEAGRRPAPLAASGRFGRRAQADRLFDAIERIADSAG
jgi:glycosyltransferase involved in cell wall biosynthesis